MKLSEFKSLLSSHPERPVRWRLPDGDLVPAHAHVTEVARIDKRFVDCGGTRRNDRVCRLQTWVADDVDHRLSSGKLLAILVRSADLLESEDLDVDVEHETTLISQYPVVDAEVSEDGLIFGLSLRHTACLAEEKCRPPSSATSNLLFKPFPRLTT